MITDSRKLLEFSKILARIEEFTNSPPSALLAATARPLASQEEIELRFSLVAEIRSLHGAGIKLPLAPFDDITSVVELARPQGAVLDPEELALLLPFLRISRSLRKLFDYRSDMPLITALAAGIGDFSDIIEPLEQTLAPDGGILDSASHQLFNIRRNKRALSGRIRKRLEEIVRERETAIFLQDDFITQRNGRWVIPVRMDSKGMVPGVVHDVSRSGETAFMEPIEVIGMVNELENLGAEERAEELRILRELTGWIRADASLMLTSFDTVVQIDFLNAIAQFAGLLGGATPGISADMTIRINAGYHPLLLLFEKERAGRKVIPLDLELSAAAGVTTMLVTGPNTGGKTIAIKGAGLLTMMAQTGIPVPADPSSIFPATAVIAADIGDDQSLEESLSTFSAHIGKIAAIIEHADNRTLVLLDELGTGTDPVQGGAIACAVLAELQKKGCLVLATTHLIDIVAFVQKSSGMVNAAMEFDRKSLTPSYRLTVGEPGQSHAIDTARRCGLPERVLALAEAMTGKLESEFHGLLAELRSARNSVEELLRKAEQSERQAVMLEEKFAMQLRELEQEKRAEREKRLLAEKELLAAAKREINGILTAARSSSGKKALQEIAARDAAVEKDLASIRPGRKLDFEKLAPGAMVFVKPLGRDASIVSIDMKQRRARVRAGSLETELPFESLDGAAGGKTSAQPARKGSASEDPGSYELNLIGMRVEEALLELEKFLDSSLLTGKREVRIIHGIGTGALMRGVREHLARSPHVESFRKGEGFEGGDGATVVTING